ncbi:hypothetical protein V1498_06565 [Peribacillus sp. SCS-26]|uniref:hypothetical protein n=1 Tax=Paraperibacillus marinus TaxID=3115295 RepID=UPI00390658BC
MKSVVSMPRQMSVLDSGPSRPLHLRVGLWEQGRYYDLQDKSRFEMLGIQRFEYHETLKNSDGVLAEFSLSNMGTTTRSIKMVCILSDPFLGSMTAFYSPQEDSVIGMHEEKYTYASGMISQRGLCQYAILDNARLRYEGCFKSMARGELFFSPLAKGSISIIYTLESTIEPDGHVHGSVWAVTAAGKEEAAAINQSLRKKPTSILV